MILFVILHAFIVKEVTNMKITTSSVLVVSAAALWFLTSQTVHAQRAQLNRIAHTLSLDGYSLRHESEGSLGEGRSTTFSLWLRAGADYSIRGTCDDDCPDLDLELRGPNGSVVDRDLLSDDIPIVETSPHRSGRYTVRIIMASCSIEPCGYTVGVFER